MEDAPSRALVGILLLLAGVAAFWWFPGQRTPHVSRAAPVARPLETRRYAMDGTYYLMRYVAARTPRGVYGFEPGCEVHVVESAREKQTLLVSDGCQSIEVSPSLLTRDPVLADALRWQDQAAQAAMAEERQRRQEAYETAHRPIYIAHAQDVQAAELARMQGSIIGNYSSLDLPPQPVGGYDNGYNVPVSSGAPLNGNAPPLDTDAVYSALRQSPFARLPSAGN